MRFFGSKGGAFTETEQCTYELLKNTPPSAAVELIEHLVERGARIGVASGAPLHFINYITSAIGLLHHFHSIASSEEVENGKPAPDVFLLSAERLGVRPDECIVIEDSINGMLAARAAAVYRVGRGSLSPLLRL